MAVSVLAVRALTAAEVRESRHLSGWVLIGIGIVLLAGWIVVLLREGRVIWESQARLGYALADVLLVFPGCIISGAGVLDGQGWGPPVLLLTAGAAAYDLTHFFVYLFQAEAVKLKGKPLPWWVYAGLIVLSWAFLAWVAYEAVKIAISTPGQLSTPPMWIAIVYGVTLAIIVVMLSLRSRRPPGPRGLTGRLRGW